MSVVIDPGCRKSCRRNTLRLRLSQIRQLPQLIWQNSFDRIGFSPVMEAHPVEDDENRPQKAIPAAVKAMVVDTLGGHATHTSRHYAVMALVPRSWG